MLHTARLLLALAGLAAAGSALAHAGIHPHVHPHFALDTLLVMLAGAAAGVLYARRAKRPPSE